MLLVYGPASPTYDFGPGHPLTPRRFGPGIGLLAELGATPGLAPEPASDEELGWCHTARYIATVRRFSRDPFGLPDAGIGEGGDDPPFAGMHEAGAMVAGGTLRALESVLHGDVEHAFHPGGGLHHAMPGRASGFCIYDDPAIAIARARQAGLRVLYLDFDVHHGDGVQAIHWADPGVLTLSIHESGRYLFPGTGNVDELGDGEAAGSSVNIPLEPGTGEDAWLRAIRTLAPELAAAFGPDLIVSQHGADSHAWDPLAHLRMTTTAMGEAARLVDGLAHGYARGRWLATGGGGYDAYRVVPRAWSHVWLAGTHREAPTALPEAWRERWASEAARYRQAPLPSTLDDPPNAGLDRGDDQELAERRSSAIADLVRRVAVPALLREARDRGWWDPVRPGREASAGERPAVAADSGPVASSTPETAPTIVRHLDAATWDRLVLEPRIVSPADGDVGHTLIGAALRDGARVTAAVAGGTCLGLAVSITGSDPDDPERLLAVGVAPAWRRRGIATALLDAHGAGPTTGSTITVTVAERDWLGPLDRGLAAGVARRLLERGGYRITPAAPDLRSADAAAIAALRPAAGR